MKNTRIVFISLEEGNEEKEGVESLIKKIKRLNFDYVNIDGKKSSEFQIEMVKENLGKVDYIFMIDKSDLTKNIHLHNRVFRAWFSEIEDMDDENLKKELMDLISFNQEDK